MRAPIVAVFAVACGRIDIDPLHSSDAFHANYSAAVLADSPIIYFRFDDHALTAQQIAAHYAAR